MNLWKVIFVVWIFSLFFKEEVSPDRQIDTLNINEYQGEMTEPISTTAPDVSPFVVESDAGFSKISYIEECIAATQKREVCQEQGESIFDGITTDSFLSNAEHIGSFILYTGKN